MRVSRNVAMSKCRPDYTLNHFSSEKTVHQYPIGGLFCSKLQKSGKSIRDRVFFSVRNQQKKNFRVGFENFVKLTRICF